MSLTTIDNLLRDENINPSPFHMKIVSPPHSGFRWADPDGRWRRRRRHPFDSRIRDAARNGVFASPVVPGLPVLFWNLFHGLRHAHACGGRGRDPRHAVLDRVLGSGWRSECWRQIECWATTV